MKKDTEEEATEEVNALETTEEEEESDSEQDNSEESEEAEVKVESGTEEEIKSDYLDEGKKEEIDYKKRYGDSTTEYQKLKERTDGLTQVLDNLEKLTKLNPRIVAEIEAAQGLAQSNPDNSSLIQQQVDRVLEPVKKIAQDLENKDRQAKVKTLAAFEKKNPDLFSPKATSEEKRAIRQRIGKVANALVESGMDFPEAVNRAYFTINPKAAVQKGKDEAYLESLGEEQAGFSGQASTEGKRPSKPKYSKQELEIGDKMGVKQAMLKDQ